MLANGCVWNGVVVLDDGVRLPEGLKVTVLAPSRRGVVSLAEAPPPRGILDIPPLVLAPCCVC